MNRAALERGYPEGQFTMDKEILAAAIVCTIIGVMILVQIFFYPSRRRIDVNHVRRWAHANHLELLSCQRTYPYGAAMGFLLMTALPRYGRRASAKQAQKHHFAVTVRTREGHVRTGEVCCYVDGPLDGRTTVRWDDAA
jgi:hypothetical protein